MFWILFDDDERREMYLLSIFFFLIDSSHYYYYQKKKMKSKSQRDFKGTTVSVCIHIKQWEQWKNSRSNFFYDRLRTRISLFTFRFYFVLFFSFLLFSSLLFFFSTSPVKKEAQPLYRAVALYPRVCISRCAKRVDPISSCSNK